MLAKMKRPNLYINHGVWVFLPKTNELVKRKIQSITVQFWRDCFSVDAVYVDGVGELSPEDVYMSRKEAFTAGIKKLQKSLNECQEEIEWKKACLEREIREEENKEKPLTFALKKVLESQDKFFAKKGVPKQTREQVKFFQELGFSKI